VIAFLALLLAGAATCVAIGAHLALAEVRKQLDRADDAIDEQHRQLIAVRRTQLGQPAVMPVMHWRTSWDVTSEARGDEFWDDRQETPVRERLANLKAKVGVLLRAVPAWGAAAVAVLTVVGQNVVPLLPGPWAVRATGYVATALAAVATVVSVVSRVTPILYPSQKGLLRPGPVEAAAP